MTPPSRWRSARRGPAASAQRRENSALKEKLATATGDVEQLKRENTKLCRELIDAFNDLKEMKLKGMVEKKALTATQFNAVLKCLQPDMVHRLGDDELTKRFNAAFKIFNGLRARLVK
jgi:hypothetical protein